MSAISHPRPLAFILNNPLLTTTSLSSASSESDTFTSTTTMSSGGHAHAREPAQKPLPFLAIPTRAGAQSGVAARRTSAQARSRHGSTPAAATRPSDAPKDPLTERCREGARIRPKDVPLPGSGSKQGEGGGAVMTAAHERDSDDDAGKGLGQSQGSSDHVDQPPQMGRTNDQGDAAYSKHSEYAESTTG
ncbi:uncharacterized protein B0H18DRAFT_1213618 [Fomitopsis serialis]|uniref:uncharacterized protein n=1 Tax=Fomitopsis serialis TaxID=139415 RepID=UPI0020088A18|nr:uncharacterized protein B0H18DRAFT_1213618 [Neoantrodia serialis]KAH9919808.1 hypothetical protein B0H18DRAFT_1213618 [Neoantrodia serialis]